LIRTSKNEPQFGFKEKTVFVFVLGNRFKKKICLQKKKIETETTKIQKKNAISKPPQKQKKKKGGTCGSFSTAISRTYKKKLSVHLQRKEKRSANLQ
jgi:hypothetical protein